MTSPDPAQELVAKARTYRLVLAPSGKAFANLSRSCVDSCDTVLPLAEAVALESVPDAQLVLITDLEAADTQAGEWNPLGLLRQRVNEMLDGGASVILLSRYPRIRYPEVAGSSLLEDARDYHPPFRESNRGAHRLHALPAWEAGLDEEEFLTDLVSELGVSLAARLDQILFECPLNPTDAIGELSSPERDALHFAGLIRPVNDSKYGWSIPKAIPDLKEAVANVLASSLAPPRDLAAAYELLWRIERRIRAALRARAIQQWGSEWKSSITSPNYVNKILKRAGEVAYPDIRKVTTTRDPLEWLTLAELLALRQEKEQIADLGMEAIFWRRLETEVMPIRNQVSHMRLTKPGDLGKLKHWEAILTRRLKT
jgi:hypothetical protein